MPRGGRRAGAPGKTYQNRSDLTGGTATPGSPLPVTAATGQPYGAAGAQRAAQQAVPMSTPGVAGASPTPPQGSPQPGGPPSLGLPAGGIEPGELPPLTAPTDRPDEHLMTGVDAGPGAGSDALNLPAPQAGATPQTTAQFLAALAAQPGAPGDIVALASSASRSG